MGDVEAVGGDRGDRLAEVANALTREDRFVAMGMADQPGRQIVGREHGADPGQGTCRGRVVTSDTRVRVGAAEQRRVQHARAVQIVGIDRRTRNFRPRFELTHGLPDD